MFLLFQDPLRQVGVSLGFATTRSLEKLSRQSSKFFLMQVDRFCFC